MIKEPLSSNGRPESQTPARSDGTQGRDGASQETRATAQRGLPSLFRLIRTCWLAQRRWLQANSFSPGWLPRPLRRPASGYLAVFLVEIVAVFGIVLLIHWCSEFAFKSLLPVLGVILVALNWGAWPGLLATLWGAFLLDVFVLPPPRSWDSGGGNDLVSLLLLLLVGTIISLVAGQSSWTRRKAEEIACSLRDEQAKTERERLRLRTLLNVLPAPVGMVDAQGLFLERTPACKTLWGEGAPVPRVIADYQLVKAWWPDSGQPLAVRDWALTRALTTGTIITNKEVEVETFDGQHKVVVDSAAPICDATGAIIGAVGMLQDITERRRLEEALRQAEREAAARASQLEVIFETIVDGVFVYDLGGHILRANSAGRRLLNLDERPEFCLLPLPERITHYQVCYEHDEHLPMERWPLARMLRGEVLSDLNAVDVSFRMLDGRGVEGSITGAPLRDSDGQIAGAVMVLCDQTERQRLERRTHEALKALLAMAEALVQGPDEGAPGQETRSLASLAAHRLAKLASNLLGYSSVSISSLDLERGICEPLAVLGLSPEEEQRWWAGERRSARWTDGSHQEVLMRLQAGETLVMDMSNTLLREEPSPYNATFFLAVPMRFGERLVGLLILNPRGELPRSTPQEIALAEATAKLGALVIEWERLLREREAAQASVEALHQTNQRMDAFLGLASHELKTPLTTVILGLQWGQRRLQSLLRKEAIASHDVNGKLEALYDQISYTSRQATRLDRLVNDLLDVSRIQTDQLAFRLESVDLGSIIREVVQEQCLAYPQRSIQVAVPANQSLPVCADAGRIEQVVMNYLTNALKYSAEDEPVEIGVVLEAGAVRLWVRDHGPGIPFAEQEHIWERFHRVPGVEVRSGSGVGLGLGLYISKTIITRHHGQVGVESLPGEGATFWFTLPLSCPKAANQAETPLP